MAVLPGHVVLEDDPDSRGGHVLLLPAEPTTPLVLPAAAAWDLAVERWDTERLARREALLHQLLLDRRRRRRPA